MCGICGFNWNDRNLLKSIMDSLKRRGPDDSGIFEDRLISLGHRRLSIIDLSKKAHQPMSNEEGDIWIVFNGEIYNYQNLKKVLEKKHDFKSDSDTEVILHLYEEYGKDFPKYLNGDFAIAIYDSKKKRVYLARDRFGVKQVYYVIKNNKFIFSSEIKGLLKWDELKREINKESLNQYLLYGDVPNEKTILNDVKKVLPSEIVEIDLKNLKIISSFYYTLSGTEKNMPYKTAIAKVEEILEDSIKKRMIADVPVGAYLSGGLDSSTVVYYMSKLNKNLNTFSVGFESKDVENELEYAKIIADKLETKHHEIRVTIDKIHLLPEIIRLVDEPIPNLAAVPYFFLSKEASKKVKVVLTGNGGDEVFAGYRDYKIINFVDKTKFLRILPFKKFARIFPKGYKRYLDYLEELYRSKTQKELFLSVQYKKNGLEIFNTLSEDFSLTKNIKTFLNSNKALDKIFEKNFTLIKKMQIAHIKNHLADNFLTVDDKMTMAHSIESRVPFLDHRLVDLSLSLPDRYKLGISGKRIIRRIMHNKLPNEITNRHKYGFTAPLRSWFKDYFKEDAYLRLTTSDLFKKEEIKERFSKLTNQDINQLWRLYWIQLWNDIFINNERIKKI